jgi:CRP/FNR family transcriptional regulator, cyclic AMP receptor protein
MRKELLSIDEMRAIAAFGGLGDDGLTLVRDLLVEQQLSAGQVLFREGDPGHELFIVISGEIEVLKGGPNGRDTRVALLGPHDMVGEMAMLDLRPRSATVRALAPTTFGVLTNQSLDAIYRRDVKGYSLLVLNMAREVSRRLRVADGLISGFAASISQLYNREI